MFTDLPLTCRCRFLSLTTAAWLVYSLYRKYAGIRWASSWTERPSELLLYSDRYAPSARSLDLLSHLLSSELGWRRYWAEEIDE
jgi:hypothetical protein